MIKLKELREPLNTSTNRLIAGRFVELCTLAPSSTQTF
jgi:hypothetical protein